MGEMSSDQSDDSTVSAADNPHSGGRIENPTSGLTVEYTATLHYDSSKRQANNIDEQTAIELLWETLEQETPSNIGEFSARYTEDLPPAIDAVTDAEALIRDWVYAGVVTDPTFLEREEQARPAGKLYTWEYAGWTGAAQVGVYRSDTYADEGYPWGVAKRVEAADDGDSSRWTYTRIASDAATAVEGARMCADFRTFLIESETAELYSDWFERTGGTCGSYLADDSDDQHTTDAEKPAQDSDEIDIEASDYDADDIYIWKLVTGRFAELVFAPTNDKEELCQWLTELTDETADDMEMFLEGHLGEVFAAVASDNVAFPEA